MANVNIKFNNKDYLLSCDDGQEENLKKLADHLSRKFDELKKEGIFVGYTSGAAFQAIKQLNNVGEFKDSDKIVVVFPDHGTRYLSKIYSDKWMEDQGFFDSKHETTLKKIQYIK